jgi:branched-chain amino acid transport system permease protein
VKLARLRRWTLALIGLTLLLPLVLPGAGLAIYVFIGLDVVVVAGLSLLMGFAGQVSLGQAAFFAIGAYTAALLARNAGVPAPLALLVATVATAACAYVVGLPLLRLRGHSLAFGTLALQLITLSIIGEARDLTGGDTGLPGIPGPSGPFKPIIFAYVVWLLVAGVLVFNRNLILSRPGRALRALATSESAALGAGVPVVRYKLQVFALSAAYAGLAGGVYAFFVSYIAPGSFPVLLSIQFLIMATVGGLTSIWGSLIGTALVFLVVQLLQTLGTLPGMPLRAPVIFSYAVYGSVLVFVILRMPQGVIAALQGVRSGRAGAE